MKEFKNKINKQLVMSYLFLIVAELLVTTLYMVFYNNLLSEVISDLKPISFLQAYIIYYAVRLVFNRNKTNMELHEEVFDSLKRTFMKFIHYLFWMLFIFLVLHLSK